MKFEKYLSTQSYYGINLRITTENLIRVKDILNRECSQFLKIKTLYFRGSSKENIHLYKKFTPRIDRKPKDTGEYTHDLLDELFYDKFKWKPRSEGVFATPSVSDAEGYGEPYIFFPVNNFKYIWSPKILDLYGRLESDDIIIDDAFENALKDMDLDKDINYNDVFDKIEREHTEKYQRIIDRDYTNKNLEGNILSEVAFKCKAYYLIDYRFERFIEEEIIRKGMK